MYLTVVSPLFMTQVWGLAPSHASLRDRERTVSAGHMWRRKINSHGDARARLASDDAGRRRKAASQVAIGVKGGPGGGLTSYEAVERSRESRNKCDSEDGEVGEHDDRQK